jgi:hypothetical protein
MGCDACLLITIEPDGTEHVVVTHYDPEHVSDHLELIREKKNLHPNGKKLAFLLTFGRKDDNWRRQMESALTEYQGSAPEVVSLPDLGIEQARELMKPQNKLKYQLAFTRGFGGDMKAHRLSVPGTDYDRKFKLEDL